MPDTEGLGAGKTTAGWTSGHQAWLDVRKGRRWPGAYVPGEASVADGALLFTISERRLARKERLAVSRLPDPQALAEVLGRDPYVLRIPLRGATLTFPQVPLLGRTHLRIRPDRDGHPDLAIKLLYPGDPAALDPFTLTWRLLRGGPAARRRRDELRAEIERELRR